MKLKLICSVAVLINVPLIGGAADRPPQGQDSNYTLMKDRVSAESTTVRNLGLFVQSYAQNHNGSLPASWSQLDAFTPLSAFGNPPIQERYALVTGASPSDELGGAQVLIIGDGPSSDAVEKDAGRFIVYRTKNGEYLHGWYPEEKAQKIITQMHVAVPPPSVTPPPSTPQPLPPVTTSNQLQETNVAPPQTTFPDATPSAPTVPPPTPKPIAEITPASDTGIPVWLYGIVVLSIAIIAGGYWYFFLRPKK